MPYKRPIDLDIFLRDKDLLKRPWVKTHIDTLPKEAALDLKASLSKLQNAKSRDERIQIFNNEIRFKTPASLSSIYKKITFDGELEMIRRAIQRVRRKTIDKKEWELTACIENTCNSKDSMTFMEQLWNHYWVLSALDLKPATFNTAYYKYVHATMTPEERKSTQEEIINLAKHLQENLPFTADMVLNIFIMTLFKITIGNPCERSQDEWDEVTDDAERASFLEKNKHKQVAKNHLCMQKVAKNQ